MRIIPVLDAQNGRAVHALRGERRMYGPVSLPVLPERGGDATALARWYRRDLGLGATLYLADLDAIEGTTPQRALQRSLAEDGALLWVDAGVRTPDAVRQVVDDGARRVIIALETLSSPSILGELVEAAGAPRTVFSLDLRSGVPVTRKESLRALTPVAIARMAAAAGIPCLVVLDLARVGTGSGVDWALIEQLRRAVPALEIIAGGGIGSVADLVRLADAGAHGALVASALHDGRISAQDVGAFTR